MKKIYLTYAFLAAFLLSGCTASNFSKNSYHKSITLNKITGDKETNKKWKSDIDVKNFNGSLLIRLFNNDFVAINKGRYLLNVNLLSFDSKETSKEYITTAHVVYDVITYDKNTMKFSAQHHSIKNDGKFYKSKDKNIDLKKFEKMTINFNINSFLDRLNGKKPKAPTPTPLAF